MKILWFYLFLVYINDLEKVVLNSNVKLYADDAKIYFSASVNDLNLTLQYDLDRIFVWASEMQLSVAISKCYTMHLGHGNPRYIYRRQFPRSPEFASAAGPGTRAYWRSAPPRYRP